MVQHKLPQGQSDHLRLPWSWCARCHRAYVTGTGRVIRFTPDALHPHPATLSLCPYPDCRGSTARDGWLWSTIRLHHAEYPATPERNVIYAR